MDMTSGDAGSSSIEATADTNPENAAGSSMRTHNGMFENPLGNLLATVLPQHPWRQWSRVAMFTLAASCVVMLAAACSGGGGTTPDTREAALFMQGDVLRLADCLGAGSAAPCGDQITALNTACAQNAAKDSHDATQYDKLQPFCDRWQVIGAEPVAQARPDLVKLSQDMTGLATKN